MSGEKTLQILRSLDKADRMSPHAIFALLTEGRRDQSGDFTQGCELNAGQALVLTGFIFGQSDPRIFERLRVIDALDQLTINESGQTAWEKMLEWFDALPEPKDIAAVIDNLIEQSRRDGSQGGAL